MKELWKRTWTEINLDNLIFNFNTLRSRLNADTKICCVVKANAYGHHAPRVAKALEEAGAEWFAVSNIEEALQLRHVGIQRPILILGYTPADCASILVENDISQCVYSYEYAKAISENALLSGHKVKTHIKIDTGMGRIGFQHNDINNMESACCLSGIELEGIFTHFALSDMGNNGRDFTRGQYDKFTNAIEQLEKIGFKFKYKHCANSAACFDYPEFQMNMVRAGIVLYGLTPSSVSAQNAFLKPVMALKTVVSHVKEVSAGSTISYGCDFMSDRKMKIATVPMGYADGFLRSNGKNGISLLIKGKKAPIVGRICMDQLMLDVSEIDDVEIGDEVTVFGDRENINTADDLARANGTINYEIICSVGKRVPRVFIKDGKVDGIHLGIPDSPLD